MKLVSFLNVDNEETIGIIADDGMIVDLVLGAQQLGESLPPAMELFLKDMPETLTIAMAVEKGYAKRLIPAVPGQHDIKLQAPVPHPPSCRDAYAFRQHVASARLNRGLEMIPEFDKFPVFYFTNHRAIIGPGDVTVELDHLDQLDFELEVAAVIGRRGKNIYAAEADAYIAGYTIMNDLSARRLQMEEMKLSLGPAKGKDFATALGPWLVTVDELEQYKIVSKNGNRYNLTMTAAHNGKQISQGNMRDMSWTFAQIIARASYGVELVPGDVIGSGTVGTGCYLELNGTSARAVQEKGQSFNPVWLKAGDVIELEVTGLGKLSNRIVKAPGSRSMAVV